MIQVATAVCEVKQHLQKAGIGAILPSDLPLSSILPVADALLAAPVTAVEIQRGSHSGHIIHDLRQRAQGNMLIGLSEAQKAAEIDEAIAAGAHFVSLAGKRPSLIQYCQQKGIFCLPTLQNLRDKSWTINTSMVRVKSKQLDNLETVHTMCKAMNPSRIAIVGDIKADAIPMYKQAGASLIFAGTTLFHSPQQTMANIITRARQLQQAWEA